MAMRIVARQGPDRYLLIEDDPIVGSWSDDHEAHILDREKMTLGPTISMQAVLARGYWDAYEVPVGDLLDGVKRDPGSFLPRVMPPS